MPKHERNQVECIDPLDECLPRELRVQVYAFLSPYKLDFLRDDELLRDINTSAYGLDLAVWNKERFYSIHTFYKSTATDDELLDRLLFYVACGAWKPFCRELVESSVEFPIHFYIELLETACLSECVAKIPMALIQNWHEVSPADGRRLPEKYGMSYQYVLGSYHRWDLLKASGKQSREGVACAIAGAVFSKSAPRCTSSDLEAISELASCVEDVPGSPWLTNLFQYCMDPSLFDTLAVLNGMVPLNTLHCMASQISDTPDMLFAMDAKYADTKHGVHPLLCIGYERCEPACISRVMKHEWIQSYVDEEHLPITHERARDFAAGRILTRVYNLFAITSADRDLLVDLAPLLSKHFPSALCYRSGGISLSSLHAIRSMLQQGLRGQGPPYGRPGRSISEGLAI